MKEADAEFDAWCVSAGHDLTSSWRPLLREAFDAGRASVVINASKIEASLKDSLAKIEASKAGYEEVHARAIAMLEETERAQAEAMVNLVETRKLRENMEKRG